MYVAHALLMISTSINGTPVTECHCCGAVLGLWYDYACAGCGLDTCDMDIQWCPVADEVDCEFVTCFACVDTHLQTCHPGSIE